MTTEDDTWAQTLITVTPEADATLREISERTTISAPSDVQLILDPDEIVFRRSFTHRQFVDSQEADEEEAEEGEEEEEEGEEEVDVEEEAISEEQFTVTVKQDAENQTYLQGTPTVHISTEYRDEASQTMYMSTPCPPLKYYKDIITSMNEAPMPILKRSNVAATILSFHPEEAHDSAMEQLFADVTDEERGEFESKLSPDEETEMEITEILNFLIARAFWIDDPMSQAQLESADKATQTYIKYNNRTKMFVVDNEVQTDLSCEPKESNTKLLVDYWETKNMILSYLEDCITRGIETRIIIDDIIAEILDKCAERIRYPMKEQMIQTIATYKFDGEKEEDVLRKLKLEMVVDPLEASIIVLPLMDVLLQLVCEDVSKNAVKNVKDVLDSILQRTMVIIAKLMQIQKESQRKPIDQILAKRKKKIQESLSKKETETIYTQTSIAAISDVKKIKKSKEVICSICRRPSMCQWCMPMDDQETEGVQTEEMKILRTQDILLAYKPCYIVTKVSEKEQLQPTLQPPCPPEKKAKPSKHQLRSCVDSRGECYNTVCIFLQGDKEVDQESCNEWSYVADATIMKPCSIRESVSSSSQTTVTLLEGVVCQNSSSHHSTLTSQAVNALQILKDTFCTREKCINSSLKNLNNYSFTKTEETYARSICSICSSINNVNNEMFEEVSCAPQTCKAFSKLHLPNTSDYSNSTSSHIPIKSHGDGFKIIPIYLSDDSCT